MKIDNSIIPGINQLKTATTLENATINKDFAQELAKVQKLQDDKKLYTACQELESVFLSKVMESMRATIPHSDLINRGFATETFESMLFDEYAKKISQTDSIGIADILYRQLKQK